jgi:hypothetical protein
VRRGETANLRFPVKDADGDPITLTGSTVKFRVATSRSATTYLIDITSGGQLSFVNVDGTADAVQVALTTENTDQAEGRYYGECQVTTGGNVKVVAAFKFVILDSITN